MASYAVDLPVTTDQQALQDFAVAYLQAKVPGYVLDPAHPETWLIEVFGAMAAEDAFILSKVPLAVLRYFGRTVYGIPSNDGSNAVASTTWVARDTDGHTIPAGTLIVIDDVPFSVDVTSTILPGNTSVANVAVTAVDLGTAGNALGVNVAPVDSLAWISSISVVGTTSGGEDAETDEDYQNRLSQLLQLQGPRPITARDFGIFTAQYAGVDRVTVLDLYNPYTNLLSLNQASLESSTTGWSAIASGVSRNTSNASDGTASLQMQAAGTAPMGATATKVPINPGQSYTAAAEFKAAATPRATHVDISWYDASNALVSTSSGSTTTTSTSTWTQISNTATAPATATQASVLLVVNAPVLNEIHYADKIALKLVPLGSASNTTWSVGGVDPTVVERMVTIIPIDANGDSIRNNNATLAAEIAADLDARREVNFVVNLEAPQYTALTIAYTVVAYADFDLTALQTAVNAALSDYISPANWGTRPYGDVRVWDNTPVVRRNKLIQVVENVEGVNYVNTLTINGSATDLTMAGIAPLPSAASVVSGVASYT